MRTLTTALLMVAALVGAATAATQTLATRMEAQAAVVLPANPGPHK